MKEKALYSALVILLLACLGQAYYIHTQKKPAESAQRNNWPARTEKLNQDVQQRIHRGEPPPPAVFDDFFNDDFFGRKFNPFAEMELIHRQMAQAFQESERRMLDNSWDNWFNDRMGMEAFRTNITRTDKNVAIAIDIPGIDDKTADISINADRIRISFTAKNVQDKKDEKGAVHQESSRSYTKIMPVPEDAVATTAKTSIANGKVTITFGRKGK